MGKLQYEKVYVTRRMNANYFLKASESVWFDLVVTTAAPISRTKQFLRFGGTVWMPANISFRRSLSSGQATLFYM